jgi:hypothetical protein
VASIRVYLLICFSIFQQLFSILLTSSINFFLTAELGFPELIFNNSLETFGWWHHIFVTTELRCTDLIFQQQRFGDFLASSVALSTVELGFPDLICSTGDREIFG